MSADDAYRNDLEAAQARIAALEAELEEDADEAVKRLKEENYRLHNKLGNRTMLVLGPTMILVTILTMVGIMYYLKRGDIELKAKVDAMPVEWCSQRPTQLVFKQGERRSDKIYYLPEKWDLIGHPPGFEYEKLVVRGLSQTEIQAKAKEMNCPLFVER